MNEPELFLVAQDKSDPEASREARNQLVLENMGLVHFVARKQPYWASLTYDDIVSEGTFGLIRAIELFDTTRGIAFSTYATPWIRQKIRRALDNQDLIIRIPAYLRNKRPELKNETTFHYDSLPTLDIIEGKPYAWEPEETQSIDVLLEGLSEKERDILLRHNGVNTPNGQPMTLMALAKEYETSKQRIHQIYDKALAKTQTNLLHPNARGNK